MIDNHRKSRATTSHRSNPLSVDDVKRSLWSSRQSDPKVRNIREIFYKSDGKLCKNIFVRAAAGLGKTTFCKHLVYLWCKAHKEPEHVKSNDLSTLKEFPLLFYIDFREANVDSIEHTKDQYASLIEKTWNLKDFNIKKFLSEENCLIVADGLDDYEYGLPTRGRSNFSTILTTSRPWKLEELKKQIEGEKVDRLFEIAGLDDESSKQLIKKVIPVLANECPDKEPRKSQEFIKELREKGIQAYLKVPLLLLQMLCLWYEKKSVGSSKFEIYSNFIHHQMQLYFDKKYEEKIILPEPLKHCPFRRSCDEEPCRKLSAVVQKLFKHAFHTFMDESREMKTIDGMSEKEIKICFDIGVLSQQSHFKNISKQENVYSFVDKRFRDFFVSIFLANEVQLPQVLNELENFVSNPDKMFKLWNVLIFLSDVNLDMAIHITDSISKTVERYKLSDKKNDDNRIDFETEQKLQELIFAVVEESSNHSNKFSLRTLYLDRNQSRFLASFSRFDLSRLSSITVMTWDKIDDLLSILRQSVSMLVLIKVEMSHECWVNLCQHLMYMNNLKMIVLNNLKCKTHEVSTYLCGHLSLDLRKHVHLESLQIDNYHVYRELDQCLLSSKMINLRQVSLLNMTMTGEAFLKMWRSLPTNGVNVDLIAVSVDCPMQFPPADVWDEIRESCDILDEYVNIDGTKLELGWFKCKKNEMNLDVDVQPFPT